ncbi:MAG: HIT domain-containing protein [Candidatus Margulisbacteria bacterium]|jgi:histidine triad (HIT) family protein|nr:HIT domain-containing protein [Candidatus Margulisiibacteriota bacterium]
MCVFCQIINKEIPTQPVYEDANVLVIEDLHPQAPIHWLMIPKIHVESFSQAAPDVILACALGIQNLLKDKGIMQYRIVTNTGADGGQTVPHLHFHILAGRALGWPPG